MAETKQETKQETEVQETGAQEPETIVQEDKSPGITNELRDTIESLKKIKVDPEEFKKKDRSDPKKKKLEDDLIKIMNDFNQTIEYLFWNLDLNDDRLEHDVTPSHSKTGKGIEDEPREDETREQQAETMGGNKSKTQKKQSKNKNKNKTQKKH